MKYNSTHIVETSTPPSASSCSSSAGTEVRPLFSQFTVTIDTPVHWQVMHRLYSTGVGAVDVDGRVCALVIVQYRDSINRSKHLSILKPLIFHSSISQVKVHLQSHCSVSWLAWICNASFTDCECDHLSLSCVTGFSNSQQSWILHYHTDSQTK